MSVCAHTHMFMCSCVEDGGQLWGVLSIHHMDWQAWGQLLLAIESCLWPLFLSVYSITCWIQAKNISWKLSPSKGETCCLLVICSMMKKPSGRAELLLLLEHWSCIYTLHQSLNFTAQKLLFDGRNFYKLSIPDIPRQNVDVCHRVKKSGLCFYFANRPCISSKGGSSEDAAENLKKRRSSRWHLALAEGHSNVWTRSLLTGMRGGVSPVILVKEVAGTGRLQFFHLDIFTLGRQRVS